MFSRRCVFTLAIACFFFFFFQAEDGIRDKLVTGVQTCALPICPAADDRRGEQAPRPARLRRRLRRVPAAHGEGVRCVPGLRRIPGRDGAASRRAAPAVIDYAALARQSLPALLVDRARRTPERVAYRAKTL